MQTNRYQVRFALCWNPVLECELTRLRFFWTWNRCLLICGSPPLPQSSRSPLLTRLPPLSALLDLFPVLSATTSIILLLLPPLISPSVNHTLAPPSLFPNRLLFGVPLQQLHVSPQTLQTPSANAKTLFLGEGSFFAFKRKTNKKKSLSSLHLSRLKPARYHPRCYRHFPSLRPKQR